MAHAIKIGKSGRTPVTLDLESLVEKRALITATIGAGKSYLMRVIAEQTAKRIQTIILDPEGEFSSLRDIADVVIAGDGGDIPAHPGCAKLLARRLVEKEPSAVIDLSHLTWDQRKLFARDFCESFITLPKRLTHELVLMIDEAHRIAPESGHGKSVATEAVSALLSQGRKYLVGVVLATQRLSKLKKDVAAECGNILVGRTSPIDLKRAEDLLGVTKKDGQKLRALPDGEFFVVGPSFSEKTVVRVKIAKAKTTHLSGKRRRSFVAPAPSTAIKKIAGEFADLPQEAHREAADLAEARGRIRALERDLARKPKPNLQVDLSELQRSRETIKELQGDLRSATARDENIAALAAKVGPIAGEIIHLIEGGARETVARAIARPTAVAPRQVPRPAPNGVIRSGAQTRLLTAIVQNPSGLERTQLALLAGVSIRSSAFSKYLGELARDGMIDRDGAVCTPTAYGAEVLGDYDRMPTDSAAVRAHCLSSSAEAPSAACLRPSSTQAPGASPGKNLRPART